MGADQIQKTKLLVIDEKKDNLVVLKSLLKDLDIQVFTTENHAEGLALTASHDFALVLLNIESSEVKSFEFAEQMRDSEKTKNLPIIFISAASKTPEFVFCGYESGAVDFLYKPVNPTILKSKIKIFMEIDAQKKLLETKMAELKAAKNAAENANRLKSTFLANMSHEIRTPLNAVIGFADLLRSGSTTEEERMEYLDVISRSGKSLVEIINDVLDISKVEAGYLEMESIKYSPLKIVKDVLDLLSVRAKDKGVDLKLTMRGQIPKESVGDPTRFKQIVTNIMSNAIKFTDHGFVEASVDYDPTSKVVSVKVEDTGVGIGPEQEKKIFMPFVQADNSITRKYGGTGLGLVLAKRLAQVMGGDVKLLKSEVNKGSTFLITIKHIEEETSSESQFTQNLSDLKKEKNLAGMKVLLVEDSIDNQMLMEIFLTRKGIAIDIAQNGEEGVKKALAGSYDLVLMDIQMPVLDGYQATKQLREKDFKKPVIALTAHAMLREREKCLQMGCTDFLSKPIDQDELIKKLSFHYKKIESVS